MFKKMTIALVFCATLSSAASIKFNIDDSFMILNSSYITQMVYTPSTKTLTVAFLRDNKGMNFITFTISTKQKAEEIIKKVFNSQDNSIIPLVSN